MQRFSAGHHNTPLKTALDKALYGIAKLLVLAGCKLNALIDWLNAYETERDLRYVLQSSYVHVCCRVPVVTEPERALLCTCAGYRSELTACGCSTTRTTRATVTTTRTWWRARRTSGSRTGCTRRTRSCSSVASRCAPTSANTSYAKPTTCHCPNPSLITSH